uniref:Uncharacterized protein n=1 Tax=Ananas comosus var. bracteatus TaxID=296719 RepID=A0A6V7PCB3_ANACO|nr:unnamed protein product [Ananas comosus var. bracteatus]
MSRSPIFPIPEPHHFSDYGFDPQIDYFQKVLEEARRHVRRGEARGSALDSLHLKLKKPISKEKKQKQQQQQQRHRRRHWWRSAGSALLLWKRPKSNTADLEAAAAEAGGYDRPRYPHRGRCRGRSTWPTVRRRRRGRWGAARFAPPRGRWRRRRWGRRGRASPTSASAISTSSTDAPPPPPLPLRRPCPSTSSPEPSF